MLFLNSLILHVVYVPFNSLTSHVHVLRMVPSIPQNRPPILWSYLLYVVFPLFPVFFLLLLFSPYAILACPIFFFQNTLGSDYIIRTRLGLYNPKLYDPVVTWSTWKDLDDELHRIGSDYIIRKYFSNFGLYNPKRVRHPIKSQQLEGKRVTSEPCHIYHNTSPKYKSQHTEW
jgi:hypothetical protein